MSIDKSELDQRTKDQKALDKAVQKHFSDEPTSAILKKTGEDEDDLMTIRHSRKVIWKGGMGEYMMALDRLSRDISTETQHD